MLKHFSEFSTLHSALPKIGFVSSSTKSPRPVPQPHSMDDTYRHPSGRKFGFVSHSPAARNADLLFWLVAPRFLFLVSCPWPLSHYAGQKGDDLPTLDFRQLREGRHAGCK